MCNFPPKDDSPGVLKSKATLPASVLRPDAVRAAIAVERTSWRSAQPRHARPQIPLVVRSERSGASERKDEGRAHVDQAAKLNLALTQPLSKIGRRSTQPSFLWQCFSPRVLRV